MNKIMATALLFFSFFSISAQREAADTVFHRTISDWFSAWELVYRDIYEIENIKPVDFVLFDERYVYSTSEVSIETGEPVSGPDLLNLKLNWKKKAHQGMLTLPDGSSVPVGMMCFAAESAPGEIPFFVMPLPTFWYQQSIESKILRLEDLVTGVFLHEFSHTQQMENFGKKINELVKLYNLGDELDDNFIQTTFQSNPNFAEEYHKEVAYFSEAVADRNHVDPEKAALGWQQMHQRRQRFFIKEYAHFGEIEDIFLTMEGLGQYSMYVWLTHEKGKNLEEETAIEAVRRNKKVWSQDEGFILFLILERYHVPSQWAEEMFGTDVRYVTDLLKQRKD